MCPEYGNGANIPSTQISTPNNRALIPVMMFEIFRPNVKLHKFASLYVFFYILWQFLSPYFSQPAEDYQ